MSEMVGCNIHLMRKSFEEVLEELESKEKKLNGFQESVTRGLECTEERLKDLKKKEAELKELQLVQENGFKELELKRKELAEDMEEFRVREQKLRDREKAIEIEREKIEITWKDIKQRSEEISRREEELQKRRYELAGKFLASLEADELQAIDSVLGSRKKQCASGENISELASQEVDGTLNLHDDGERESEKRRIGAVQSGESQGGRIRKRGRTEFGDDRAIARNNELLGSDSAITRHPSPEISKIPAPESHDFAKDKRKECFAVSQYWACYDSVDGMPRTYVTILQVYARGFRLRVTELVLDPEYAKTDGIHKGLPSGCGRFISQESTIITNAGKFSHRIVSGVRKVGGAYLIYPSKGQIWALFKDWDSRDPKKLSYEIVAVLSDFAEGIRVAYLKKIVGYVSLFHRTKEDVSFVIGPEQMFRFSHQIPSYKMNGSERKGIPEGSLELDPAALPTHL